MEINCETTNPGTLFIVYHYLAVIATWCISAYLLVKGITTSYYLHKNRDHWNCGNLSYHEACTWTQGITTISLMLLLAHTPVFKVMFSDYSQGIDIFHWAIHAVAIGALLIARRVILYLEKSAKGECFYSHPNANQISS